MEILIPTHTDNFQTILYVIINRYILISQYSFRTAMI